MSFHDHRPQAQGIVKPGMYVAAFANVWNIFMNWFLIFACNWGFIGAAAARITTQWMMVFCLLLYMKVCIDSEQIVFDVLT